MLTIIIALAAFLLGFICGKRNGKQIGYSVGLAEAPLLLRQKSWEKGSCLLCCNPAYRSTNDCKPITAFPGVGDFQQNP